MYCVSQKIVQMPKNKNALIRYKVINKLLLNGRSATKRQMADKCSETIEKPVSLRTIENDLNAMRNDAALGYEAPISYDYNRKAYYYLDPDFSIDGLRIADEDLKNMLLAARLLSSYQNIPEFRDYGGSINKVINLLNFRRLILRKNAMSFIEFESHPKPEHSDNFGQLVNCIHTRTVIQIKHQAFDRQEEIIYTLHPYFLKEYNMRWYLLAWCEERDAIRIFGLERIHEINRLYLKQFKLGSPFNAEQYFRDFIGVHVPEHPPVEIVLRFKNHYGHYLISKPLHHSQELIEQGSDWHIFRYKLSINIALIGQILQWGKEVEVIEPASLRNEIKKELTEVLGMYKE